MAAGYNSDVTGDIFIHIKENSLISEETVWGGGTGDSTITGGVTITVDDSSEVIGEIRAGGNEGADVIGDVVITVSGGPQSACPTIFATGKGEDEDNPAQVDGNVSITLHGSRANVYTLDKFGEVTSDHTVTIILDDTDELSGAVRGDSKLGQHLYNYEKNTPTRTGNGASVIVKGDYTSTGIHGFPEVVIEDGGILREHLASGETLFDGVETVTIQEGGALDLLQSNEISGNFTCAGTLKMPAPISAEADICYLTGGSNVTVQEGAAYVLTKDNGAADADYVKGDVFLKQGTVYTEPSAKVDFAVSEAGQAKEYFTDDRAVQTSPTSPTSGLSTRPSMSPSARRTLRFTPAATAMTASRTRTARLSAAAACLRQAICSPSRRRLTICWKALDRRLTSPVT